MRLLHQNGKGILDAFIMSVSGIDCPPAEFFYLKRRQRRVEIAIAADGIKLYFGMKLFEKINISFTVAEEDHGIRFRVQLNGLK